MSRGDLTLIVALIVALTVLLNAGGFVVLALSTRRYRRKQAGLFAAHIVLATTAQVREMILDLQSAVSVGALEEMRNRIDHSLDVQAAAGAVTAQAVREQVESGTLPAPLTPPSNGVNGEQKP